MAISRRRLTPIYGFKKWLGAMFSAPFSLGNWCECREEDG